MLSLELARFFADHATIESQAAFTNGIEAVPTAAGLAAAMCAKGYQVGDAEVAAALEHTRQRALTDQQLKPVVGGQGNASGWELLATSLNQSASGYAAVLSDLSAAYKAPT